jgi:hypothetical protein
MPDTVIAMFGLVFSLYRQRCEEMFTAEAAVTRESAHSRAQELRTVLKGMIGVLPEEMRHRAERLVKGALAEAHQTCLKTTRIEF